MEGPLIITTRQELIEIIQGVISLEFQKFTKNTNTIAEGKNPPENPNCLIEVASKITGLAVATIRTKCHFGEMPYFKPPGTKKLQFNIAKLTAWMESGNMKTTDEMEEDTNSYLTSKKRKQKRNNVNKTINS